MAVPLLDLRAQYAAIREEARAAFDRVADSQQLILGPEVEAFEREAAAYSGCRHALACSSGTDAILMALMAAGVGPGDEVILPSFTFFATAGSVARLCAKPVFCDSDPLSLNLDVSLLRKLATPRTKAIMPVHLYGQCADMDPILLFARERKLAVIEDAAQAIGAEYKERRAGSMGEAGCLSFYPTKNLGGFGDGGMVTCQDDALAERLRMIRVHGSRKRYYHEIIGGNFRMDAIQGAILRIKLRRLDDWTLARQRNAARYNRLFQEADVAMTGPEAADFAAQCRKEVCALEGSGKLLLPMECAGGDRVALRTGDAPFAGHRHVYNQYVIRTWRRETVMAALKAAQVGFEIYYPVPLHEQECFKDLGCRAGQLPASECAARCSLALPIYPELTEAQQDEVVRTLLRGLRAR